MEPVGKVQRGRAVAGVDSVVKLGPDCILIGEDGFQPMAHYLQLGQSQARGDHLAQDRQRGDGSVRAAKTEAGWQRAAVSRANMLIFNIPSRAAYFISMSPTR